MSSEILLSTCSCSLFGPSSKIYQWTHFYLLSDWNTSTTLDRSKSSSSTLCSGSLGIVFSDTLFIILVNFVSKIFSSRRKCQWRRCSNLLCRSASTGCHHKNLYSLEFLHWTVFPWEYKESNYTMNTKRCIPLSFMNQQLKNWSRMKILSRWSSNLCCIIEVSPPNQFIILSSLAEYQIQKWHHPPKNSYSRDMLFDHQ